MDAIDRVRGLIRSWLRHLARFIDQFSQGRITPNHITLASTAAHAAVAWTIIQGELDLAALLLAVFGLMDALDGELARIQNRDSTLGIVLDATSDRLKETMVYGGITVHLSASLSAGELFWVVAALGLSLTLSYIKAKGEAVLASQTDIRLDPQTLNRFVGGDSLMQFDVRMAAIVVGLLFNVLWGTVLVIAAGSLFSVISRYGELRHVLERD